MAFVAQVSNVSTGPLVILDIFFFHIEIKKIYTSIHLINLLKYQSVLNTIIDLHSSWSTTGSSENQYYLGI